MIDVQVESDGRAGFWQEPVFPRAAEVPPVRQRTGRIDGHGAPHLRLPPDIAFLAGLGLDPACLLWAAARGQRLGIAPHRCLIAAGWISAAEYAVALGQRLGAPMVRAARLDPRVTLHQALRQGWCRAVLADGARVMLCRLSGPLPAALLARRLQYAAGTLALATDADYQNIVLGHFAPEVSRFASETVPEAQSSRTGLSDGQRWLALWLACVLGPLALAFPAVVLTLIPLLLGLAFLASTVIQLSTCIVGYPDAAPPVERHDHRLPDYSVLVPLHREAGVVDDLVAALRRIDYPPEKLQILLVVEQHDLETQAAIRKAAMPAHMRMFIAPSGAPKTKPRAINAAMPFVTGELVVVYDAEDRPDPMQLCAAAATFRRAGPDVACLQARLAIDHAGDTWLTRLFTIEYAALFDVTKAGQARMGLPVPLGGTSNHFRAGVLRDLGCWDAWNVTEDADLGIRLAARGYRVVDLNSTTGEEAPTHLRPWMHQRARWLKGWMQTVIAHSRAPLATLAAMGPVNAFAAFASSLGVVVGIAFAPLFHAIVAWRIGAGAFLANASWLDLLADALVLVLGSAGIMATFLPPVLGVIKRRRPDLLPWIVLLPAYHLLMAAAAWRALYELVKNPHGWNKTTHGVARASRRT